MNPIDRLLCWILGIRLARLEANKNYMLFYTPRSGLAAHRTLQIPAEWKRIKAGIFLMPCLSLDEMKLAEKP